MRDGEREREREREREEGNREIVELLIQLIVSSNYDQLSKTIGKPNCTTSVCIRKHENCLILVSHNTPHTTLHTQNSKLLP